MWKRSLRKSCVFTRDRGLTGVAYMPTIGGALWYVVVSNRSIVATQCTQRPGRVIEENGGGPGVRLRKRSSSNKAK